MIFGSEDLTPIYDYRVDLLHYYLDYIYRYES